MHIMYELVYCKLYIVISMFIMFVIVYELLCEL
jgi:hypothetical protein